VFEVRPATKRQNRSFSRPPCRVLNLPRQFYCHCRLKTIKTRPCSACHLWTASDKAQRRSKRDFLSRHPSRYEETLLCSRGYQFSWTHPLPAVQVLLVSLLFWFSSYQASWKIILINSLNSCTLFPVHQFALQHIRSMIRGKYIQAQISQGIDFREERLGHQIMKHHLPHLLSRVVADSFHVQYRNGAVVHVSQSRGGRVIAYGCLIRREGARREHLDYIYRGLMSQHPHFTATPCSSSRMPTT